MSGRGRFNTRSSSQNYNKQSGYNTRNSYGFSTKTPGGGGYHREQQQQSTPPQQQPSSQQQTPQQPPPQQQTPQQPPPQQQTPQQPPPVAPQKSEPKEVPPPAPVVQEPPQKPETKPENNVAADQVDVKMDALGDEEEGATTKPTKLWNRRRVFPGAADFNKIPRRVRKRRQNARLKTLLAPKNALMVLYELHPELKVAITEQFNAANQLSFTVELEVDGQKFKGHGMSKMAAKQVACENALKAVLIKKMVDNNTRTTASKGPAAGPDGAGGWDTDVNMEESATGEASQQGEEQNGGSETRKVRYNPPPEDDVPWGSLASFALFKLFSEWQAQGFQFPTVGGLQSVPNQKAAQPHAQAPVKKLPPDANTKHPVQLLNQIRPGCQYVESREGVPPNLIFTFTVTLDELNFKGVGQNKKEAKKQCAKHALEHLGVVYND